MGRGPGQTVIQRPELAPRPTLCRHMTPLLPMVGKYRLWLSRASNLSRLFVLGWTQEVPDFAVPVQPVQPVQPKIKTGGKEVLGRFVQSTVAASPVNIMVSPKRPAWLDRLDRANNEGHFSRPTWDREAGLVGPEPDAPDPVPAARSRSDPGYPRFQHGPLPRLHPFAWDQLVAIFASTKSRTGASGNSSVNASAMASTSSAFACSATASAATTRNSSWT